MMTRNLNRRVELLFPLIQSDTKKRAIAIYNEMWEDNIKTRVLHGDKFSRIDRRGLIPNNSQESFIQDAEQKMRDLKNEKGSLERSERFSTNDKTRSRPSF